MTWRANAVGAEKGKGVRLDDTQARLVVAGTYRRLLCREPTAAELDTHSARLVKGELGDRDLWDEIYRSEEIRSYFAQKKRFAFTCFPLLALLLGAAFYTLSRLGGQAYKWGMILASVCLGAVFLAVTIIYSVNIPFWDDFDAVLEYLYKPSSERFSFSGLVAQHNEHRIVFSRLSILFCHMLNGGVMDFRLLAVIGALPVLGVGALVYLITRSARVSPVVCPIILMGVFSVRTYENINWGMSSTQHSGVVFFGLLCLWLWSRPSLAAKIASLAALLAASFSSPSGVLLCPVLIAWTLLKAYGAIRGGGEAMPIRIKKLAGRLAGRWRVMIPLLLITLAILGLYFNDYRKPSQHPSLLVAVWDPHLYARYLLHFMGTWLPLSGAAELGGAMIWLWFGLLTLVGYHSRRPLVYYILLFLMLNAVLIGLARSGLGLEQALASRYRLVAMLAMGMCLISFFDLCVGLVKWRPIPAAIAAGFFFLYLVSFHYELKELSARRDNLTAWMSHGRLYHPVQSRAQIIMRNSLMAGIYRLPPMKAADGRPLDASYFGPPRP